MELETLEDSADGDKMLLDLFTEIAIIEHLVRVRMEPYSAGLTAAQFGIVNYFVRQDKKEEKLATLAWCFQVKLSAMQALIGELQALKLVEMDWVDGQQCVFLTGAGRAKHAEAMADMAPDILSIMSEFSLADLRTTTETLKEIRRTFDNLPDR
ncbi:MAG: hypothetical protein H0X36_14870 [Sphingomonadaceae bacterium]|nr:hypothetical protein [Sphingomonadaceae bacterium]